MFQHEFYEKFHGDLQMSIMNADVPPTKTGRPTIGDLVEPGILGRKPYTGPEHPGWDAGGARDRFFNVQKDPTGKDQHEAGAKLDSGKNRLGLVLGGFANALQEVGKVGTLGANKYTDNGWLSVDNAIPRYTDAMLRHMFADLSGEKVDPELGTLHLAQACWNLLAVLELSLRNKL